MSQDNSTSKLPTEKTDKKISPPSKKPSSASLGLAMLSLLIAIATAAIAVYIYKFHIQPNLIPPQQMVTYEKKLSDVQRTLLTQQHVLGDVQKKLNQYQQEKQSGTVGLDEAEYLIKLAMFNLNFGGNASVARQLLQTADEKIQSLGDPKYWPLRQAIAKDLAALDAVSKVDLPGIVSRLNALSEQVESLPHAQAPAENLTAQSRAVASVQPASASSFTQKLQVVGQRVLDILSRLVVITRDVPKAAPLLPPDQYAYVITNIQSKLSTAEWAVLYHQPQIYQQSLMQAKQWAFRYFAESNNQVVAFIKSLEELMAISVKPAFPDLSNTLNMIDQIKNNVSPSPAAVPHSEAIRI